MIQSIRLICQRAKHQKTEKDFLIKALRYLQNQNFDYKLEVILALVQKIHQTKQILDWANNFISQILWNKDFRK